MGDFSRHSFDERKRYSAVLQQQGRVHLDAEWNEQAEIARRCWRIQAQDTLGSCAVPKHTTPDGFRISLGGSPLDLQINPGRIYVDGLLAEIFPDESYSYFSQPFYPNPPALPAAGGTYVVFLDVWEREISYIQDADLLEKALGGVDTTTRWQTVWQVKVHPQPDGGCGADMDAICPRSGGRLSTQAIAPPASEDPCIISPTGGYRGLENRLYYVSIHDGTSLANARFKWSRQGASIVSALSEITTSGGQSRLTVSRIGRDAVLRFQVDDWVEIVDDHLELHEQPGTMARVLVVSEADRQLTLDRDISGADFDPSDHSRHTRVRRWDQRLDVDSDGLLAVSNTFVPLEDGVEVRFGLEAGEEFRPGDYWAFAARTADGSVELLDQAPPRGIRHHCCQLASLEVSAQSPPEEEPLQVRDCRRIYPALRFLYVGGGGQQAGPGERLPCALQAGVMNGHGAVQGARVRFRLLTEGGGILIAAGPGPPQAGQEVTVETTPNGVARCLWQLGEVTQDCLQVEARLLSPAGQALNPPIRFNAQHDLTSRDPGIGIQAVISPSGNQLRNDVLLPVDELARGILIECDQPLSPESFGTVPAQPLPDLPAHTIPSKPTCFVTLDLPYPLGDDRETWSFDDVIGFQPLILSGRLEVEDRQIRWIPYEPTQRFLTQVLFQRLTGVADRLLAYLTVKGNFIWLGDGNPEPEVYLDGDAFGRPENGRVGLRLPSGDGRRGGDFEMWFWLFRPDQGPILTVNVVGTLVAGVVRDVTGVPVPGISVSMVNVTTGQGRQAITNNVGEFRFAQTPAGQYRVEVTVGGVSAQRGITVPGLLPPIDPIDFPNIGVIDIPGVGNVFRDRLEARGITHPAEVGSMQPEVLAEILEINENRAARLVLAARNLLLGGDGQ